MTRPASDLAGARFGRLTVVCRDYSDTRHRAAKWTCVCDCGKDTVQRADVLKSGGSESCGCLARELSAAMGAKQGPLNATHGHSRVDQQSGEYCSWMAMKARCLNSKNIHFANYGGRGIEVCDEWLSFENFLADMGPRPSGHTLDRKNSDGNYEPGNCQWATVTEQNRNRRDNVYLTYGGIRRTLGEWSEATGIGRHAISVRINKLGWSVDRALSEPARKFRRR